MKYRTIWMLLLALALAASAYPSAVTEVTLDQRDDGVVATVTVDGPVRFVHQVEGPKDGKPYRVIVDVLAAAHQLGKQSFLSLPADCPVRSLRTSQYAVTPEKICRLVFDMKGAPLYKINKVNNTIEVFFTDPSAKPFKTWSTKQFVKAVPVPSAEKPKAKTVASKSPATPGNTTEPAKTASAVDAASANKTIQQDRTSSLAAKQDQSPATPSRTPSRPVAKTEEMAEAKKPTAVAKSDQPKPAAATAAVQGPQAPKAAPEKTVKTSAQTSEKTVAQKPKATQKPSAVAKKADKPADKAMAAAPQQPKQTAAESKAKAAPTKAEHAKSEPAKTEKTKLAVKKAASEPTKKTSRFRRSPEESKLRGTMVAQFPQRLVVKYKARNTRDPFQTLINDHKTDNSPLARRVPNVEGLRLVGIIEDADGANQALFEDVDGYSYILKSGDKVKRGYVLRVETDRVYFQIFEYGWSRTLALNIEEE